eukprot:4234477-Prymnesium_polylepis.1
MRERERSGRGARPWGRERRTVNPRYVPNSQIMCFRTRFKSLRQSHGSKPQSSLQEQSSTL